MYGGMRWGKVQIMSDQTGSQDGEGAGDHDTPYQMGNSRALLNERAVARLLILRGRCQDAQHGFDEAAAQDLQPAALQW